MYNMYTKTEVLNGVDNVQRIDMECMCLYNIIYESENNENKDRCHFSLIDESEKMGCRNKCTYKFILYLP